MSVLDHVRIDDIQEGHLQALVMDHTPEDLTLEFKERLPGRSEEERKEFLADVTSFANTAGGHLVFGIREARDDDGGHTGLAGEVMGLPDCNLEEAIHRLESLILSSSSPVLQGCLFKRVVLANGCEALVLRVPRSWSFPHALTLGRSLRFYARRANGKYPLGVPEIRAAFLQSDSVIERIRRFRFERTSAIMMNDLPMPLIDSGLALIHIIPLSQDARYSVPACRLFELRNDIQPPWGGTDEHLITVEGVFACALSPDREVLSYALMFRDGAIEYVDAESLRGRPYFRIEPFERRSVEAVTRGIHVLRTINIPPPFTLSISLIRVRGYQVRSDRGVNQRAHRIHRDEIHTHDTIIESTVTDIPMLLKPHFDVLWNAGGWLGSASYQNGRWQQ